MKMRSSTRTPFQNLLGQLQRPSENLERLIETQKLTEKDNDENLHAQNP